jgi:hypothetical protein
VFGPGAIVASLTIGTGELIFSSRGGAIFGYRTLFLFLVILLLKWSLVLAASRHIVLSGVHPYERMMDVPGPRGWLLLVLFLCAAVSVPIWISFHSGVLGNLISWLTGTGRLLHGGTDYLWGAITWPTRPTSVTRRGGKRPQAPLRRHGWPRSQFSPLIPSAVGSEPHWWTAP